MPLFGINSKPSNYVYPLPAHIVYDKFFLFNLHCAERQFRNIVLCITIRFWKWVLLLLSVFFLNTLYSSHTINLCIKVSILFSASYSVAAFYRCFQLACWSLPFTILAGWSDVLWLPAAFIFIFVTGCIGFRHFLCLFACSVLESELVIVEIVISLLCFPYPYILEWAWCCHGERKCVI